MSYQRDTDPEVLADLRLRERTARERKDRRGPDGLDVGQDPDGLSPAIAALYEISPDPDVEHWPCRGGCGRMVGVPQAGVDGLAQSNRQLAARRDRPIGKHEVMWCPDCKRREDEERAARLRPHEQSELREAAPVETRPSWQPTPRAERRRNR